MTRKSRQVTLSRASAAARAIVALTAVTTLSGCLDGTPFPISRSAFSSASEPVALGQSTSERTAEQSAVIADLRARRSVLTGDGPYAEIARGVIDHSAGTAQADLRVKRLTAKAKSRNWLPQIGPTLSLSRLGDMVAQMLVEQVLFDNGAKRAEREFAAADVEVAAVNLSVEMNDLVREGIGHYLSALKARDQAAVADRAVTRITDYDRIMRIRVEGGLSDMSEARVLRQKLSEMEARAASDRDAARSAIEQLQTMTTIPVAELNGLDTIALPTALPEALGVKLAEGEQARAIAEAKLARAGHLPRLAATGTIGEGGSDIGLTLGTDQLLGFGTGDQLAAIAASEEAAAARVEKARRDSLSRVTELRAKLTALEAKDARDAEVTRQTGASLEMFTEQYRMGRRTLMELVNMYESYAAMERDQVGLKYDIARIKLEIAREHGILVDGSRI
jgi:adhesin transport system outer membrane protein